MAIDEYIKGAVNYISHLLQTIAGLTMAQWANFAVILGAVVSAGALLCAIIRDRKSSTQIKQDPGPDLKKLQAHDPAHQEQSTGGDWTIPSAGPTNGHRWAKLTQSDQPHSRPI